MEITYGDFTCNIEALGQPLTDLLSLECYPFSVGILLKDTCVQR